MIKDAKLSDCGNYRYWLLRQWDAALPTLVFIMLNPSTADADQDDPTIRKCIEFAKRNGFGSIEVVNLYALRATKPADLYRAIRTPDLDAIGPDNAAWICDATAGERRSICLAWGTPANNSVTWRAHAVTMSLITEGIPIFALKRNGNASPAHPLMLAYSNKLERY